MSTQAFCTDCGEVAAERIWARMVGSSAHQRVRCLQCGNVFWEILLPRIDEGEEPDDGSEVG